MSIKLLLGGLSLEQSISKIYLQKDVQLILEDLDALYVHEHNKWFSMEVDCEVTRDRIQNFNVNFKNIMNRQTLKFGRFNVELDLNLNWRSYENNI